MAGEVCCAGLAPEMTSEQDLGSVEPGFGMCEVIGDLGILDGVWGIVQVMLVA